MSSKTVPFGARTTIRLNGTIDPLKNLVVFAFVFKVKVKYDLCVKNALCKDGISKMTLLFPSGANGAWLTGSKEFLTVSTPFTPFVISLLIRPFGKADIVVVLLYYIARLFSVIVFFSVGLS